MADFDPKSLGHGTYDVPGVGLVVNGKVFDGEDPKQVAKFHEATDKAREQSTTALAERDAVIVAAVTAPASDDDASRER